MEFSSTAVNYPNKHVAKIHQLWHKAKSELKVQQTENAELRARCESLNELNSKTQHQVGSRARVRAGVRARVGVRFERAFPWGQGEG